MGLEDECSNCCKKFDETLCVSEILIDPSLESSSTQSASGDGRSKWKKIKVSQVLWFLFNLQINEDDQIVVCYDCAIILKNWYQHHQQLKSWQFKFHQRCQEESFLATQMRPPNSDLVQSQIPPPSTQVNDNSRGFTDIDLESQNEMHQVNQEGQIVSIKCSKDENIIIIMNLNELSNNREKHIQPEVVSSSNETGPHFVQINSESSQLIPRNENKDGDGIHNNEPPQDSFMEDSLANDYVAEKDNEKDEIEENEQEQQLFLKQNPQLAENDDGEIENVNDNLTCSVCPNRFLNLCDLTHHLEGHVDKKTPKCPICNKKMAFHHLKEHFMIHTGYRPHRCPHGGCSVATKRKCLLSRHIDRAHGKGGQEGSPSSSGAVKRKRVVHEASQSDSSGESPVMKIKCPLDVCPQKFPTNEILAHHIFQDHTTVASVTCPLCTFTSSKRGPLKCHIMARHAGGFHRDFKMPRLSLPPDFPSANRTCHFCHKICSRPSELKIHLRIHTGERPFKCGDCPFSAIRVSRINEHCRNSGHQKEE